MVFVRYPESLLSPEQTRTFGRSASNTLDSRCPFPHASSANQHEAAAAKAHSCVTSRAYLSAPVASATVW